MNERQEEIKTINRIKSLEAKVKSAESIIQKHYKDIYKLNEDNTRLRKELDTANELKERTLKEYLEQCSTNGELRQQLGETQRQAAEWEKTARMEYRIHNEVQNKLAAAQLAIAQQSTRNLEIALLESWLASGIEEVFKYKNRIRVYKREGLTRYDLFCDLTYRLFADVKDIADYADADPEDYKVRVDTLLANR